MIFLYDTEIIWLGKQSAVKIDHSDVIKNKTEGTEQSAVKIDHSDVIKNKTEYTEGLNIIYILFRRQLSIIIHK